MQIRLPCTRKHINSSIAIAARVHHAQLHTLSRSHRSMRIAHPYPYPLRFLITVTNRHFSLPSVSSTLSKPRSPTLSLTMASDDLSTLSADEDKYGFQRPEMFQSKLAGTVDAYDRHVFLCYKSPEAWPSRVEGSESDPLPKFLSSAFKARKNDISVKTKLTVCEGRDATDFSDGDVLIFPDMIKYRGLKESDVDSFVDEVIVNDKPWASGAQEVLTGSHVFVCAHGSRDRRCGVCGPVLIDKFIEEAELRGLKNQVFVSPCSHIGGHKYAGNLIIYSPGVDGKITGHWYGYVAPDDVPELLDEHIGKGEIVERLWRGQMGVSADEGEKPNDQKLPNGEGEKLNDLKLPNGEDTQKSKEKHQENGTQIQNKNENFAGCCQGANGVSCCRDGSLEQNSGIKEMKLKETTESSSGKKNALGSKLTSCIGNWEQSDVLAAVAVVGAVATVGVAVYSFYRRSG